ncbi:hypothetical protein SLA2020_435060 [Shorea laevis]
MPSPPLSPDFQSELKCRKRFILSDDDTPLAYMLNKGRLSIRTPSPMSIAADSLYALRHSADPLKPASPIKPTVDLNVSYSSDHTDPGSRASSTSRALYGNIGQTDSISGMPRQEVTSTEALMAHPPALSRRFTRAPQGRPLFMPCIHDGDQADSTGPDSAVAKGVGLQRPPPHQ